MKWCGVALLCVVAIIVVRQIARESAIPLQWIGVLLIGGAGVLMLQPMVAFATELAEQNGVGEVASLLFRALGIAILCQLCADFCRQSGEGGIATGVEMAGRVQLLLLSLPKLRELLTLARDLVGNLN